MSAIEKEIIAQEIKRLKTVIKSFKINTVICILSFVLFIVYTANDLYGDSIIGPLLFIVFLITIIMFNILLGLLASLVQISVISWVGLNIIFSPLSYIFSYFKILKKSRIKLNQLTEIYELNSGNIKST